MQKNSFLEKKIFKVFKIAYQNERVSSENLQKIVEDHQNVKLSLLDILDIPSQDKLIFQMNNAEYFHLKVTHLQTRDSLLQIVQLSDVSDSILYMT